MTSRSTSRRPTARPSPSSASSPPPTGPTCAARTLAEHTQFDEKERRAGQRRRRRHRPAQGEGEEEDRPEDPGATSASCLPGRRASARPGADRSIPWCASRSRRRRPPPTPRRRRRRRNRPTPASPGTSRCSEQLSGRHGKHRGRAPNSTPPRPPRPSRRRLKETQGLILGMDRDGAGADGRCSQPAQAAYKAVVRGAGARGQRPVGGGGVPTYRDKDQNRYRSTLPPAAMRPSTTRCLLQAKEGILWGLLRGEPQGLPHQGGARLRARGAPRGAPRPGRRPRPSTPTSTIACAAPTRSPTRSSRRAATSPRSVFRINMKTVSPIVSEAISSRRARSGSTATRRSSCTPSMAGREADRRRASRCAAPGGRRGDGARGPVGHLRLFEAARSPPRRTTTSSSRSPGR